MAHDVFISYSHKDSFVAQAVCAKLEEAKIRCWYAPRNIPAGAEWATSIMDGQQRSGRPGCH
ncbi:MAG: toll/interleukin-1 receptor domain-containing protein [Erysipelotrichaceae bacterium]|nr:toll/interleukin-1 receptor domain-containing protein [Erysipelotrichaceae bacterium]